MKTYTPSAWHAQRNINTSYYACTCTQIYFQKNATKR